ncbi:calcium-binding protein [Streptomyces sp. NBC_01353]|uniref:calcium-binding protein n=1 Tax=Streptomyces sp. NBC_01353 TaxID=2903835 RepID=UPI002E3542E7|nr:calcium-binding protein [Streptomyces sp. NBC_01353]
MPLNSPSRRAGRIAAVGAAALALLVSLPGAATAAPGDLDPTFSGDGKVITDTAAIEDSRDVVIQPDGKIVTLGIGFDFDGPNDFILVRYNPDGTLDTTFGGGDGIVSTDFGGFTNDEAHALTLAGPGKIVAVGRSDTADGSRAQLAAARYNADGSLDTTFDGDGKVVTSFGGTVSTMGNAVLMGTDDNILIGGSYGGDAMVTRLTASGGLDVFGEDNSGKAVFPFAGGNSAIHSMAVYGGGTIIAGGSSPAGFGLVRLYMEFGGRDATFGDNGQVSTPFGTSVEGVELAAGGKIVAAGSHGNGVGSQFGVARYDGNGDLDPTFGGDGTVTTGFGGNGATGHDMALQDDDKIVVAGVANGDFALARFTTTGSLDTDFGGDGRVTTDFEGNWDEGRAVALQSDGRIVVAGNGSDNHAVARYSVTGTPLPPTVDLAVTKTGPTTISIGDQATYTVRVTNTSATATATGVSVSDTLTGASGTLLSATPSQGGPCTVNATTMSCGLGALAPGASATVTVVAEPRATGTLTDRVTTAAVEADPVPANNTATATTTVNNARGCTIIGRSTGETLNGTFGNDVICALSGNDTVNGGGGNDTVHAGPGNDVVNGGNGGDRLIGQSGNDRLNGDSGNDNLDTRDGVTGNDQAFGGLGFDTCTTDAGDTRNSCP